MFGLDPLLTTLLIVCISAACIFEFINGFHDTANAVATVIYTHSLKPIPAVIWSGFMNFIGVYVGGIAVAMGIVKLLPVEILVDQNVYHSVAMIMSLVITAVLWNLGTWYLGLPCSSSHTLIGSIFGIGLAFLLLPGNGDVALNWTKIKDVALSLFISPAIGFGLALFLMLVAKRFIKDQRIFEPPPPNQPPPRWIRSILILTCTTVSFSHGSNDGQKGIGLAMIILISIVPVHFALDHRHTPADLSRDVNKIELSLNSIDTTKLTSIGMAYKNLFSQELAGMKSLTINADQFSKLDAETSQSIRKEIFLISKNSDDFLKEISKGRKKDVVLNKDQISDIRSEVKTLKKYTEYSPLWVILMISISLGLGTMVGWRRIVVTVGEKIGKTHLTYSQGASAEIIAAGTILLSSHFGLPVSTTHVLSSGVAGTMVAGKGLKNLRKKTLRSIAIAWLITLPVTIVFAGGLFLLLWHIIGKF